MRFAARLGPHVFSGFDLTRLVLAAMWAFGASPAFADDASLPTVVVNGENTRDAQPLSLPTRTGSRLNLSSLDTPASVETITAKQIETRSDQTVTDAVTRAMGFTNTRQRLGGSWPLSHDGCRWRAQARCVAAPVIHARLRLRGQLPSMYFGAPLNNESLDTSLRYKYYNVGNSLIEYLDQSVRLAGVYRVTDGITLRDQFYYLKTNRHFRDSESYEFDPSMRNVTRSDYIEIIHQEHQVGDRLDATFEGKAWGHANRFVIGAEVNQISFQRDSNTSFDGSSVINAYTFDPGIFASPDTVPEFRTLRRGRQPSLQKTVSISRRDCRRWVASAMTTSIIFASPARNGRHLRRELLECRLAARTRVSTQPDDVRLRPVHARRGQRLR